jgi:hypothetical protein
MEFRNRKVRKETGKIIRAIAKPQRVTPKNGDTWGQWRYNATTRTLELKEESTDPYSIVLDECQTSAQLCDWIFQLAKKSGLHLT